MKWISTRNNQEAVTLREVLFQGLARDGGLYLPEYTPEFQISSEDQSLPDTAFSFLKTYFTEIEEQNLQELLKNALNFEIPLVQITEDLWVLELFHGPTLAFKDVGARVMAGLLDMLYEGDAPLTILAATSGDTGSAVASAFHGRPKFRVVLLYPEGKVSNVQEQQLTTFGGNVTALKIKGNFDDCQKMVKQAFSDSKLRSVVSITSANSINVGRWLPQAVYYAHLWKQWQQLARNESPVVCVPSGNLGNLAAGLVACKHGAQFAHMIGASNANKPFPDYLNSGEFSPRSSVPTHSNAMDVGNPSNFERIEAMFHKNLDEMKKSVSAVSISDEETIATINSIYKETGYEICPHTAVGISAMRTYQKHHPAKGIVLATAHPAKFGDVLEHQAGITVSLPDTLRNALEKESLAISMNADYQKFSEFLMNLA